MYNDHLNDIKHKIPKAMEKEESPYFYLLIADDNVVAITILEEFVVSLKRRYDIRNGGKQ